MHTLFDLIAHWPAACAGAVGLLCICKLVCLIRADAELRLLALKQTPADAFVNKVVWITGASQGLGEQLATQLASNGARLILSSRNAERLQAVKARCTGLHAPHGIVVLPFDITAAPSELLRAVDAADSAFDRGIDILIHNAGASQRSAAEDTSSEVLESLFQLNVIGTLRLTQAVLPKLLSRAQPDRPNRIVVVGSMAGHMPAAGQAVYAACKASLAAYFRTLHSELWSRGVLVTMCHPGPIATGAKGQVRSLYGSEGLLRAPEPEAESGKRLDPGRVAELIIRATYHGLDSCWIAKHPVLLLAYLIQYLPSIGYSILNKVGPSRVQSYRTGGSGYDVGIGGKAARKAA